MLSRIWLAAQAVWGHKWTSSNGDLPIDDNGQLTVAAALWAEGLRGLTERQVMAALDRLAKTGSEWPPNLPELRKAAFGIPAFAAVNNEILTTTSDKRTAFARLVWSFIVDPYAYRHCSAKDAERLRRDAYEQACEHLMTGGGLPPEPAGEIAHDTAHRSLGIPKEREDRVAHLRKILGPDFSEVAVTVRNEDELRKHHATQDKRDAERELSGGDL
jgi:hypothetical protein